MTFDWREYDDDTIEYHFNPRLTIPGVPPAVRHKDHEVVISVVLIDFRFDRWPRDLVATSREFSALEPGGVWHHNHGGLLLRKDAR